MSKLPSISSDKIIRRLLKAGFETDEISKKRMPKLHEIVKKIGRIAESQKSLNLIASL